MVVAPVFSTAKQKLLPLLKMTLPILIPFAAITYLLFRKIKITISGLEPGEQELVSINLKRKHLPILKTTPIKKAPLIRTMPGSFIVQKTTICGLARIGVPELIFTMKK